MNEHDWMTCGTNVPGVSFKIDRADLQRLSSDGWSSNFYLAGNGGGNRYVRGRPPHASRSHPVARAILGQPTGRVVYLNGDTLDLRRENLGVSGGW